jgi:hypothetical protein
MVVMSDYRQEPLDPAFARIDRAGEHLSELERHIQEIARKQANTCLIQFNPDPPYQVLKVDLPPETYFGMRVPILVGEICYHLRSALDYLVFELAKLDSGVEQERTQFPIEDDPNGFRGNAPRFFKGFNPSHIAAIERLQPYNGCNWVALLRDCSNPDKHRHLIGGKGGAGITVHSSLERNDFDRLLGFERYAPHPTLGKVKVKVYNTISVTFDDGTPVIYALEEIQSEVANTLREFNPDFP